MRVTAPLVLARVLHRLWDSGHLTDVTHLEEAYFPSSDKVRVRAYSFVTRGLEWRTAYWDEDWNIDGQ